MRFALLVSSGLAVAGCFYNPGSYADNGAPFIGKRVQLACLDLAIARGDDPVATSGPIVAYTFGNRCLHEIVVDLAAVRAIGIDAEGGRHAMRATDPRHELVAMQLDAMWKGSEQIEYVAIDGTQPQSPGWDPGLSKDRLAGQEPPSLYGASPRTRSRAASICVDVGAIDRSAPHEQWACVGGAP